MNRKVSPESGLLFLLACCFYTTIHSWSTKPLFQVRRCSSQPPLRQSILKGDVVLEVDDQSPISTRRAFFGFAATATLGLWGSVASAAPNDGGATSTATTTFYKSGKAPIVSGVPPRDKSDVKGTKKDPDFLRSISDCKSQCQSAGDGSLAKSKEDCLSECQDICCKTYEQCTFDIVPRI